VSASLSVQRNALKSVVILSQLDDEKSASERLWCALKVRACVCVCMSNEVMLLLCEVMCLVIFQLSCSYLLQTNTSVKAVVLAFGYGFTRVDKWMALALQVRI